MTGEAPPRQPDLAALRHFACTLAVELGDIPGDRDNPDVITLLTHNDNLSPWVGARFPAVSGGWAPYFGVSFSNYEHTRGLAPLIEIDFGRYTPAEVNDTDDGSHVMWNLRYALRRGLRHGEHGGLVLPPPKLHGWRRFVPAPIHWSPENMPAIELGLRREAALGEAARRVRVPSGTPGTKSYKAPEVSRRELRSITHLAIGLLLSGRERTWGDNDLDMAELGPDTD